MNSLEFVSIHTYNRDLNGNDKDVDKSITILTITIAPSAFLSSGEEVDVNLEIVFY